MSSTHGNNEPLPSQQISFIDLDVTEVFHPTLADFFKLLLVDKAQRDVKRGKALRVSPSRLPQTRPSADATSRRCRAPLDHPGLGETPGAAAPTHAPAQDAPPR